MMNEIGGKCISQSLQSARRVRGINNKADIVLRRRLRDQKHIGADTGHGCKRFGRDANHPHDAASTDRDEADVADRRDSSHTIVCRASCACDFRAGLLRRKAVANRNWNSRFRDGPKRLWMKLLRTEISQLCCLVVRDFMQQASIGNESWVGSEYAVNVGPDDNLIGVECGSECGSRII